MILNCFVRNREKGKNNHLYQSVHWVSESTLNFRTTCSGETNPQQDNNMQSFTPKEDFKEVLLLMSLRANLVYRLSHWSQVSFKHQIDPKALHGFPQKKAASLYRGAWSLFTLIFFNSAKKHLKCFV